MSVQQTEWPRVGSGMIVYNDQGQILMGKRLSKYGFGTWNNAGGKVEFGEDPMTAAIREAKEETNADVSRVEFLGYFNDQEVYEEGIVRHWVTLMFAGYCTNPEQVTNVEPHKHSDWKWFDLDKLPEKMWEPMLEYWRSEQMWDFHDALIENHNASPLIAKG